MQTLETKLRFGADGNRIGIPIQYRIQVAWILNLVNFVQNKQSILLFDPNFFENFVDGTNLIGDFRVADISNMNQKIGLTSFLQRRFETGDQAVWQVPDKTDGVAQ